MSGPVADDWLEPVTERRHSGDWLQPVATIHRHWTLSVPPKEPR